MKKLLLLILAIIVGVASFIVFSRYKNLLNSLDITNGDFFASSKAQPNKPQRIVSLAPNLTEILFALGLGERIVAVSSDSDHPPVAANKNKVGTFWQPNTEAIIASKPDLVITLRTRTDQQKAVADSLKRLRFKVLTLKMEKITELLTAIQKIGMATDCEQRSGELVKNISNQLNLLQSKVSLTDKVKVLWVVQVEPLRVAGRNTFINELIELAGGENAIGTTIQQYPPISSEELLACGAETIIQSAMGTSDIPGQQQAAEAFWSKFAALPAVKNNRIYVIEPDTTLRLGPRLPQGAETIARCLHPNSFK
ncbi:MAG: ABC transporter substrate-binding protein [Planctomycetota bacterium]|jgi:iron complex transport system substrate-binding protein